MTRLLIILFFLLSCGSVPFASADQRQDPREQALSDTLDLWRENRFEQLYDGLSHRNGMTRERFVAYLKDSMVRPACCHQKLNGFRLINEKKTTAKVFVRLGMEGGPGIDSSQSREFTLDHEEGRWKVRMKDIKNLAGQSSSRKKRK